VSTRTHTAFNGLAIRRALEQRRFVLRAAVFGLALLAAGLSIRCAGSETGTLQDLENIGELKTRFNRDAGNPRIVLLLSPT
jgi:hypothetical protein